MRLLHSSRMILHDFIGNVPPYAILSHTWEEEEVTFNLIEMESAKQMKGYKKIQFCCDAAAADGFEYVWVDTCCIDKSSSAELSEAINSMFRWYQRAQVCYVYLSDVQVSSELKTLPLWMQFHESRWFTRGWTLQELLAPVSVIFMSSEWKEIGTKVSLVDELIECTGIHKEALLGQNLESFALAQRMSWASRRSTTRTEDLAYCLMGLFGVNMPMLYGEGSQAFIRLQEEIIKRSDDHSIFCWRSTTQNYGGLLASDPTSFEFSQDIVRSNKSAAVPYLVTNKGVQLHVVIIPRPGQTTFWAVLDCHRAGPTGQAMLLELMSISGTQQYIRKQWVLLSVETASIAIPNGLEREIFVKQGVFVPDDSFNALGPKRLTKPVISYECQLHVVSTVKNPITLVDSFPPRWMGTKNSGVSEFIYSSKVPGVLKLSSHGDEFLVVLHHHKEFLSGTLEADRGIPLSHFMSGSEGDSDSKRNLDRGSDRMFHPILTHNGGVSITIKRIGRQRTQREFPHIPQGAFTVNIEWREAEEEFRQRY